MTVEDKRNALELAALFQSDQHGEARETVLRAFQQMLGEYVAKLLNPETDDAGALHARAKALGLVETLQKMGQDITTIMQDIQVQRSVTNRIHSSLNLQR